MTLIVGVFSFAIRFTSTIMPGGTSHSSRKVVTRCLYQSKSRMQTASRLAMSCGTFMAELGRVASGSERGGTPARQKAASRSLAALSLYQILALADGGAR